jgi:hypothetical protein
MMATGRPEWLLRDQMQDSASLSIVWRECLTTTVTECALGAIAQNIRTAPRDDHSRHE